MYCKECGDIHEASGECKYCDCVLKPSPNLQTRKYVRTVSNTSPEDLSDLRKRFSSVITSSRKYQGVEKYFRTYHDISLTEIMQRLGSAEKALDEVLGADGSSDMYYIADQYRNKFPKI